MSDFEYKIALVGPTRVGKTSLVSSILNDAQRAFAGKPVSMMADGPTSRRISANVNELEASLRYGSFAPDTISNSTSDKSMYELRLEAGKSNLPLRVLDYPGGWLTQRSEEWEFCDEWMKDANVLLIPVDAVVAMESATLKEQQAASLRLAIDEVVNSARAWAKARRGSGRPGTAIIVPVKCETYLRGSISSSQNAERLFLQVTEQLYSGVKKAIEEEADGVPGISLYYVPVNTLGCVDLVDSNWTMAEDHLLECQASFRVIPPRKRKIDGALDILVLIARQILEAEEAADRPWYSKALRYLTGEGTALRDALLRLKDHQTGRHARRIYPQ